MMADKRGLVLHGNKDDAFAKSGYSHWKKALERFDKHENSASHREALDLLVTIPSSTSDVGEMLSSAHAEEKAENRKMLSIIISTVRYLGRQGLPLRGQYKSGGVSDEKGEIDSNFLQLLKVRAEDNEGLKKWLTKSQCKYTSPDVQNEILRIMALSILRDISSEVAGKWFTIMIDETTDVSNAEQMVFCLRYVDANLEVHEAFIGLYNLERTNAEMIVSVVDDVLLRMNLSITNCHGQCYDGASNMSGIRTGVATRINALESKALYTHCYGHALNLAVQDTLKSIKVMEHCLETVHEITKLVKKSPNRDAIFKHIKDEISGDAVPGIRLLCPTRWTVRAEALSSISENYRALVLCWDAAREATKDSEARARIVGVAAQMEKFDIFLR